MRGRWLKDAEALFAPEINIRLQVQALRWVLVPLLAPLGYFVAVCTGVLFTQVLLRTCPPESVVSGACTASWYSNAELGAVALAAALGATAWVILPALAAPSRRDWVAWVAFACGGLFVTWFTFQVGLRFAIPFSSAIVAGAITALLIASRFKSAT